MIYVHKYNNFIKKLKKKKYDEDSKTPWMKMQPRKVQTEYCYVANGNFDGYWEKNLKPWDVAAAGVVLKEANCEVTDFNGKSYTPFDESIIAAANPLHRKILGKLAL